MGQRVFFGWFVVAATFVVLLLGFGIAYSFASFFDGFERDFAASRGDISLVFSLAGFLYFTLGIISGPLSDRLGPRPVVAFGVVLIALGLFSSSFAGELWQVYLGYGAAFGVGIGFAYVPSVGVLQRWFIRRRGLATGLAVTGIGVGTLAVPPICRFLVATMGWRATFQVLAAVVLVLVAAWMLYSDPGEMGLYADGEETPPAAGTALMGTSLRRAMFSAPFLLLYSGTVLLSLGFFVPFVHLAKFSVDQGHAQSWAILLISLIGVGSMSGRLLLGGVADRMGRHWAMIAMFLGLALMQAWWYLSTAYWALAVYAVLFGLFYGGYVALAPALTADFFGTRNVGGILGVLYSSVGIGTLIGPVAAGRAFDWAQNYDLPIAASASASFLALAVIMMLPAPAHWRRAHPDDI
ncbi:MAG: MCT family MFS transporter [Alphaproteobacteria bacterium]